MATPNYGYEKRQKELAKKRKKEDKLKAKTERKVGDEFATGYVAQGHDDEAPANPPAPGTPGPAL